MKNITYFNAGAGSGKTYTLTHQLVDLIREGKAKPEQVILTTFTTKAASEFKEKAKAELYKEGMYDQASRLDQAMIGTVHSVCERFIGKYWFHLGLSPNMDIMAEEDTQYYLSQSLAELPSDEELEVLHDYCKFFDIKEKNSYHPGSLDYDFWQSQLKQIIEFTTNYEIEDYGVSEEKSLELVRGLMNEFVSVDISDAELDEVSEEVKQYVQQSKRIKNKEDRINNLDTVIKRKNHKDIEWYKSLSAEIKKSKYGPACEHLKDKLSKIWQSPFVYDRQKKYIRLMFELARRWKEQFSNFKKERNLLDFNDMEKYMHSLVMDPEVASEIGQSYRYLFVDEFQDSSPIQVKIFDALSDLMEHSYWVGDYKQAIYGFRGSDVELVKSVVDSLDSKIGCDIRTLDTCYRSLPGVVEINNAVYTKTFADVLEHDQIYLNPKRENEGNIDSRRYFINKGSDGIAACVRLLVQEGARPDEIAVLSRTNDELGKVAESLKGYNIPVTRDSLPMKESRTYQLVASLLRIINSDSDTLAKATVAFLTENGYAISRIIDEKLLYDDAQGDPKTFLSEIPLIAKLTELKPKLQQQSIASMVESMIIELDIFNEIKRCETSSFGASYLQMIINTAKVYEEHSIQMDLPATINGFLEYINTIDPTENVKQNQKGVQLHTYHSAKGLEWKYVILTSLDGNPANEQKIIKREIFGVHFSHIEEPSASNPYPEMYIRLAPWIYGGSNANLPDVLYPLIAGQPLFESTKKSTLAEANRLMYVGMTRTRDVLLLHIDADEQKPSKKNPLQWFVDIGLETSGDLKKIKQLSLKENAWDVLGVGKMFSDYTIRQDLESLPTSETAENELLHKACIRPDTEASPFVPKHVSPSEVDGKGKVLDYKQLGERIPFGEQPSDMAVVGNCIHQIFEVVENLPAAGINPGEIIKSYGLESVLVEPNVFIRAWDNLKGWLTEEFGEPIRTYHERPFRMERDGQLIVGSIDFIWETADGAVLIDFKTCPMGEKQILDEGSEHYAGLYAGQLNAYTDALVSAGEKVLKRFIYYPVNGLIAEIGY